MLAPNDGNPASKESSSDRPTFDVLCGVSDLDYLVTAALQTSGFRRDRNAATTLLLDVPYGFALRRLEAQKHIFQVIAVTWNMCPEYLEDIWDLHPTILLASANLASELPNALVRASGGERYRTTPGDVVRLAPHERQVLRYVARGWCDKRIAAHLDLCPKTVRTMLSRIYTKLNLPDRGAARSYYWGGQDLVD